MGLRAAGCLPAAALLLCPGPTLPCCTTPPRPATSVSLPQAEQMVGTYAQQLGVPAPPVSEAVAGGGGNLTFMALSIHENGTKVGGAGGRPRLAMALRARATAQPPVLQTFSSHTPACDQRRCPSCTATPPSTCCIRWGMGPLPALPCAWHPPAVCMPAGSAARSVRSARGCTKPRYRQHRPLPPPVNQTPAGQRPRGYHPLRASAAGGLSHRPAHTRWCAVGGACGAAAVPAGALEAATVAACEPFLSFAGMVVSNAAYAPLEPELRDQLYANFTNGFYHGAVVWGFIEAMMVQGKSGAAAAALASGCVAL